MEMVTYIAFRVKLDEKLLPLKAELPNLGPGEGVDLGTGLEHEDTKVGHRQTKGHSLVVLTKLKYNKTQV